MQIYEEDFEPVASVIKSDTYLECVYPFAVVGNSTTQRLNKSRYPQLVLAVSTMEIEVGVVNVGSSHSIFCRHAIPKDLV